VWIRRLEGREKDLLHSWQRYRSAGEAEFVRWVSAKVGFIAKAGGAERPSEPVGMFRGWEWRRGWMYVEG